MWHCIHWTPVGGTQWSSCDPVLCFVTVARIVETWRVKTCVKIEYKQHEDINLVMWKCSGLTRVRMRIFLSVFMNDWWQWWPTPPPRLSSSLQRCEKL